MGSQESFKEKALTEIDYVYFLRLRGFPPTEFASAIIREECRTIYANDLMLLEEVWVRLPCFDAVLYERQARIYDTGTCTLLGETRSREHSQEESPLLLTWEEFENLTQR